MERHPLRIGHLVAGTVFVAVAIVGLAEIRLFRAVDLAWAGPGLLVLLGIALVVGTATRRDDRDAADPAAPAEPAAPADPAATSMLDESIDEQSPTS